MAEVSVEMYYISCTVGNTMKKDGADMVCG